MSNINWKDYEGKEIEVSNTGDKWAIRELVIHNNIKLSPFLCKTITKDDVCPWKYGRLIEEKPKINWSEYEGKEIEVSNNGDFKPEFTYTWVLYKYDPKEPFPFICREKITGGYKGYIYGRIIDEKIEIESYSNDIIWEARKPRKYIPQHNISF